MKTGTTYFYVANTQKKQVKGFLQEFFTVIKVDVFNNSTDEANRKARTIAEKKGFKLAGGSFKDTCKPHNFKTNYTLWDCPKNTKIQDYTKQDLYIHALIESGY